MSGKKKNADLFFKAVGKEFLKCCFQPNFRVLFFILPLRHSQIFMATKKKKNDHISSSGTCLDRKAVAALCQDCENQFVFLPFCLVMVF